MENFVAIDFETANGNRSSVCSVGIVVVRDGEIVDKYYSLIQPTPNFYTRFTTAVHGLTMEDTGDAVNSPSMGRSERTFARRFPFSSAQQSI